MDAKIKILVIEDDLGSRESLADMLEILDYDVAMCIDGLEGVRYLENNVCDLIISDIMMPKMNGFEFVLHVRKQMKNLTVPILMLSAHTLLKAKLQILENGGNDFLDKPFRTRDLVVKITSILKASAYTNHFDEDTIFIKKVKLIFEQNRFFSSKNTDISNVFSEAMDMSPKAFIDQLEEISGLPFNEFILRFKLEQAKIMIETGYGNLAEISDKCGFEVLDEFREEYQKHFECEL